jgi:adhesin/invasin
LRSLTAPTLSAPTLSAALASGFLLAACGGETAPSTPSAIVGVGGSAVTARAGDAVPVVVRITAGNGRALAGQRVTFTAVGGGGTVDPSTAQTDPDGQARTMWTLGPTTGVQTLNATVDPLTPLTVVANVSAGRPASMVAHAGADQRATVHAVLATPPSVRVRDAAGNAVSGVRVLFAVQAGGGRVTGESATTDAGGVATVGAWQLGATAGPQSLVARLAEGDAASVPGVAFAATATAGAPTRVEAVVSLTSLAIAGTTLAAADAPSVLVTDADRNPVAGAPVIFTVASEGASRDVVVDTDAQGRAALGALALPTAVGTTTVTARHGTAGSVVFSIARRADAPARLVVVRGNGQSVTAGATLATLPTVRVTDRHDNPVSGVVVRFVATAGPLTIDGAEQASGTDGTASPRGVSVGSTPGARTIEARADGIAPAVFTLAVLSGAPASIARVGATGALALVAYQRSAPVAFVVRDAGGFPVRDAVVGFTLTPSTLGTLSTGSAVTDAQGQTSVTLQAGAIAGEATLRLTVGSLAATFPVTIAQNRPYSVREIQGNGQRATAFGPVSLVPTVQVRDSLGNPVAGVPVRFMPWATGFVTNTVDTTDASGRADAGTWVLTAPENRMSGTVLAGSIVGNPVEFIGTGVAQSGPLRLSYFRGDDQSTNRSTPVYVWPQVRVFTAAGTPVAGVVVHFAAGEGGSVGQSTVTTDADGLALLKVWHLGSKPGVQTLRAFVPGTDMIYTFRAWAY